MAQMKFSRLFTKALLVLVLLFGLATVATAVFSAWIVERNLAEQFESKGKAIADGIANSAVENILYRDAASIQAMVDQYLEEGKVQGVSYIMVVDARGDVISHTFAPGIPPEVLELPGDRHDTVVRHTTINGSGDFMDIASPILASEVGMVHVGMDYRLIQRAVQTAVMQQTALMGAMFLVSVLAAYLLMNRIAEPLNKLTRCANQLAAGGARPAQQGAADSQLLVGDRADRRGGVPGPGVSPHVPGNCRTRTKPEGGRRSPAQQRNTFSLAHRERSRRHLQARQLRQHSLRQSVGRAATWHSAQRFAAVAPVRPDPRG